MATRSQKIKLGIFLATSGALLVATVFVFAGLALLSEEELYRVRFEESVSGLEVGAPVKLRGVRVGSVTKIELDPEDVERVRVTLAVDSDTPIHRDASAVMMMQGITGLRFIEIQDGTADSGLLEPGSFIPPGQSVLSKLSGSAEDMAVKADLILTNLLRITAPLDERRVEAMLARAESTAANVDALILELTEVASETRKLIRENRFHIRSTLANVDRTTNEIAGVAVGAGEVVSGLDTESLQETVAQLSVTLEGVDQLLERLARVMDHSEGEIRAVIYNIRLAAEGFKRLADSLQRQPSRLFFDRSPPERDLP